MQEYKSVRVLILVGVKLFVDKCPSAYEEEEDMSRVPYVSEVGSFTYEMLKYILVHYNT